MGLPVRKRYRLPFQVGQLVEVKIGKVFVKQGFDTARVLYIIKHITESNEYCMEADMNEIAGVTYEKCVDETDAFNHQKLILFKPNAIRPRRVSTNEAYEVGDTVQIAWRLNEQTPFAWWDGIVVRKTKNGQRYLVRYRYAPTGFKKTAWYTPDMMRSKSK